MGKPNRIDKDTAAKMVEAGKSQAEVARTFGVSRQAVSKLLQRIQPEKQELAAFKKQRGDILDALQHKGADFVNRVLDSLSDSEIEALTASQKMDAIRTGSQLFGIMYDKSRLEQGKSTQNVQSLVSLAVKKANERDGIS